MLAARVVLLIKISYRRVIIIMNYIFEKLRERVLCNMCLLAAINMYTVYVRLVGKMLLFKYIVKLRAFSSYGLYIHVPQ